MLFQTQAFIPLWCALAGSTFGDPNTAYADRSGTRTGPQCFRDIRKLLRGAGTRMSKVLPGTLPADIMRSLLTRAVTSITKHRGNLKMFKISYFVAKIGAGPFMRVSSTALKRGRGIVARVARSPTQVDAYLRQFCSDRGHILEILLI